MTIYEYFTAEYLRTAAEDWEEIINFENLLFWCYDNAPDTYKELAIMVGVNPDAPI